MVEAFIVFETCLFCYIVQTVSLCFKSMPTIFILKAIISFEFSLGRLKNPKSNVLAVLIAVPAHEPPPDLKLHRTIPQTVSLRFASVLGYLGDTIPIWISSFEVKGKEASSRFRFCEVENDPSVCCYPISSLTLFVMRSLQIRLLCHQIHQDFCSLKTSSSNFDRS